MVIPEPPQSLRSHIQDHDYDSMTGMLTHHAFRAYVDKSLASNSPESCKDTDYVLVYFNIENFKHYNQRYGFSAGDTLIRHVAGFIQQAFPGCPAGRYSADQFVVLAHCEDVEQKVRLVRHAFRREHKDSSIWLRSGYYQITPEDHDAGVACDRAKMACDEIRGRRDVFVREYDKDLQRHIIWRRYVLDHFDEAIEKGWIQAWCQPIIRVATGETCDVEALARWIDPTEGVVPPFEFVPVLEEARVIHRMDLAIVRDVCKTCRELADAGRPYLPVSFNLSRLDFELCDIVKEVVAILDHYGIPHSMTSVEITESALTGNAEFLKGEIDRFRAEGIEVWMDDFGSGYSSLNVLKDYTFDMVKIDMAFLRGLEHTEQTRVMLAKVIDMLKELGMMTLVEGVETQDQYDFLRTLGCGRVQGWLFGKASSKPESIEGIKNDVHPATEQVATRAFYENIGHVNLMRPDPKKSASGHYLPSDVAAAIVRRTGNHFEFLNTNVLYEEFLVDIGIGSLQDAQEALNDAQNERGRTLVNLALKSEQSDAWERYLMAVEDRALIMRMRPIARMERMDACAYLTVVDEVIDVGW